MEPFSVTEDYFAQSKAAAEREARDLASNCPGCGAPAHEICRDISTDCRARGADVRAKSMGDCHSIIASAKASILAFETPANPKKLYGDKKLPIYLVPFTFVAHVCLALYDGMRKYGLVNWRAADVEAATYVSAMQRHIGRWMNGERVDPVSKVHHLAHLAACCCIIMDAEANGSLIDNRPQMIEAGRFDALISELEETLANLNKQHADKAPVHYYIDGARA